MRNLRKRSVADRRAGFTLIELLVVVAIIAVLMALLLPAIQGARETARETACRNNLKQFGVALHGFEGTKQHFPASWNPTLPNADGTIDGWSAQARLLPYLEQGNTFANIDFKLSYNLAPAVVTADGSSTLLGALRNPTFLCPAEVRDEPRFDGGALRHYPINYAVNCGVWFLWDPATDTGGPGVFYPKSKIRPDQINDGLSNTIAMAEVKGWNPYYRNLGSTTNPAPGATNPFQPPLTPAEICTLGGDFKLNSGHTEWIDGRAHQIGFTTTFGPNTKVLCDGNGDGILEDVDWTNQQEGKSATAPTWAAVTSRSYHGDKVNILLMDGSVRSVDNAIDLGIWRALSTRAGKEILPKGFHQQ